VANTESIGNTAAQAQRQRPHSRRHSLRYGLQEPLDVTVLRSGVPDSVPGRSLNLGAGGLAAVLAGELLPGEVVGVEVHLPKSAVTLRARARVRHHDKLRCGMEFVGLTADQQAAIRSFAEEMQAEPEKDVRTKLPPEAKFSEGGQPRDLKPSSRRQHGKAWLFFLVLAAILFALFWWRWNRVWEDLESGLGRGETTIQPQAHVPADVMEKLVTHRVDPDYPAAARPAHLQGVIVLDVIVGRDGKVAQVRALNGPEVLAQAATEAMRWWRFEPYRVDGNPEVVETTVAVEFKP
jgi:TonB family protein